MAKLGISTGTVPNDNTGDSLIIGAIKINKNFDEIYTYLGAGTTDVLSAPIWSTTSVGISTLRNVGIGTTNPTSTLTVSGNAIVTGVITATTFNGTISNANYANNAGFATYSSTSGVSTSTTKVSIAETTSGTNSIILSSGSVLGINSLYIDSGLTYNAATNTLSASTFSGTATYATTAGISTYSSTSGISTYATTAGISTLSQGLTGTPNIYVGIITSTSLNVGSGGTIITALDSGLIGINSTSPSKTLDIIGDVKVGINTSQGIILTSPSGTQYRLIVDDSGNLSTTSV